MQNIKSYTFCSAPPQDQTETDVTSFQFKWIINYNLKVSSPPVTIQINLLNDVSKCKENPIFRIIPPGQLKFTKIHQYGFAHPC